MTLFLIRTMVNCKRQGRAQRLLMLGNDAAGRGQLDQAAELYEHASLQVAPLKGGMVYFLAHYKLGEFQAKLKNFRESEVACRKAVDSIGRLPHSGLPGGYPEVRNVLALLADSLVQQGKYGETVPLYQSLITLWREAEGKESTHVASYSQRLGVACSKLGLYEQGLDHLAKAVDIFQAKLGLADPGTASALSDLGIALLRTKRYREAERSFKMALDVVDRIGRAPDEALAAIYNNLGVLYYERGESAQAKHCYDKAIAIREAVSGQNPKVLMSKGRTTDSTRRHGRLEDSEQLLNLAIPLLEAGGDPALANSLEVKGDLSAEQGLWEDAASFYRRARDLAVQGSGSDLHKGAELLRKEARALRQIGRCEEADELFATANAIRETLENAQLDVSDSVTCAR